MENQERNDLLNQVNETKNKKDLLNKAAEVFKRLSNNDELTLFINALKTKLHLYERI